MSIRVRRLRAGDSDLKGVAEQLNSTDWYEGSQDFTEDSLRAFVTNEDNFYLIASIEDKVVGGLHAYGLLHPDGRKIIYIDEVDTIKQYRRQGVGKAMMVEMLKLATEYDATEAWLGTEEDNLAAMALYKSLNPYEEEQTVIFSYKTGKTDG